MDDPPANSTAPSSPLRWFPEFLALGHKRIRSQVQVMGSSILVGLVAGLGAVLFYIACQVVIHYALDYGAGYRPLEPGGEHPLSWLPHTDRPFNPWMLLVIPTIGGLISGVLVFTIAPEAEGHGTDAVIAAYHLHQGQIRPRVPLVKIVASAITIGTGGSGGREGPIAQIGAGFGSLLANLLHFRPRDRRILLAAGMGAGIAAIFRAPLAGALFAAEVLYWSPEFEPEVILPAALASVVAYCTFGAVFGWQPLFGQLETSKLTFENPWQLGPYTVLALCMVVLAMFYTRTFYGVTYLFHRLPLIPHVKPAIGAFLTGALGVGLYLLTVLADHYGLLAEVRERLAQMHAQGQGLDPDSVAQLPLAVLAFGYGILQTALTMDNAPLAMAGILLAVAVGKLLTTSLTIGSGGSGGVFGPSMVIGGCGGGALGILMHWLFQGIWPGLVPHPASFIVVGMAGFFAAAAKTPFSTLIIVVEMTGNYNLLLPTLWVCVISFLLSDGQSLYRSQVESRSRSPAHLGSYVREVLAGVCVSQFLKPGVPVPVLHPGDPLTTVLERLADSPYTVLPVVDPEQRLQGVVNLEEVYLAAHSPHLRSLILATDLMRADVVPLRPEDSLDRAQELFVENDLLALPVVDSDNEKKVIGMVRRSDIASTYLRYIQGSSATGATKA